LELETSHFGNFSNLGMNVENQISHWLIFSNLGTEVGTDCQEPKVKITPPGT